MKKLLALLLVLVTVMSFAACGGNDNAAETTTEPTPEETTTEPVVEETEAPTDAEAIVIDKISTHENGWMVDAWGHVDTQGIYFNAWSNDAPYNTDWTVEYTPVSSDVIKLVRDGEVYEIGIMMAGTLVKFSGTEYYLKADKWMINELFPFVEGDVVIVEGDFVGMGEAEGYTIHMNKFYMQLKTGGITKFTTEAPEGITE